jgi:hypothetical protein
MSMNPQSMQVLQAVIEKILRKHGIDSTKDFYLKIHLPPPHLDLLMERSNDVILVGNEGIYFVFDYNGGTWFPSGFHYDGEDIICSFFNNGKRLVYPDTIKRFWMLQKIFTRNLRVNGYFENGVVIQEGIGTVTDFRLIEKDEPNPMKDLSEYSKPED